MPWDDNLSAEQRAAASHNGSHARLIAGPGTGKTLALTRRAEYLIRVQNVTPQDILLLTFTRAAAAELRARLQASLGAQAELPRVSTLHSFALRQLLRHPQHARLPNPIRIADDYEERWIIEEELAQILTISVTDVRALFRHLANDWERLAVEAPGWEESFEAQYPRFLGGWREHRNAYGYTLRGELVYQLKVALEQRDLEIEAPRRLLVDEYQDLNSCDLAIVKALAGMGAEIYGAGDDDQSIYGFRFAAPEGIRRFPEDYAEALSLDLRECRRCAARILAAALFVAEQDPRRLPKVLHCPAEAAPGEVHLLRFADQDEEAHGIAQTCQWLIQRHGLRAQDILILFRADRNSIFSNPVRASLAALNLPISIETNPLIGIDEGRPGRQLLALLRLVHDREDSLAWRTLLKERTNGIGDETLRKVYELARERGHRVSQVLPEAAPVVGARGGSLQKEIEAIQELLREVGQPPEGGLQEWVERSARLVIAEEAPRSEALGAFRRLRAGEPGGSLEELLRSVGVSLGEFEQERPQEDAIAIMTMHQAKGLTAEAVFIVGAEREYIPGRAVAGGDIDDARRLLYVSMTRPRRFLYITFCAQRTGAQRHTGSDAGKRARHLSPFLEGLRGVAIEPWLNFRATLV